MNKAPIPLVTNSLMVDLHMVTTEGSNTHNEIEAIITKHFKTKFFSGSSTPSIKKAAIVRNILTNLALVQDSGHEYLVFPTGHRNFDKSRYLPEHYSRRLAQSVLGSMVESRVIRIVPCDHKLIRIYNTFGGTGTCEIRPATQLQLMISREFSEITKDSVSSPKSEIIILKGAKTAGIFSEPRVDYLDDSDIGREALIHRLDLNKTNEYLKSHAVLYAGDWKCNRIATTYHRIFNNGSLQSGGRYFGNFIQTLPRVDRSLLTIDGESISNVDYTALHYNLLRWKDGATTSMESDPFTIAGYEGFRDEFKSLTYILLNAPKKISHPPEDLKDSLTAKGWTDSFLSFKKILLDNCPLIAKYEGQGLGLELMNIESRIMGTALTYFMETHKAGFVIMHDALLVPTSKSTGARAVLMRAFNEFTGYFPDLKVTHH